MVSLLFISGMEAYKNHKELTTYVIDIIVITILLVIFHEYWYVIAGLWLAVCTILMYLDYRRIDYHD